MTNATTISIKHLKLALGWDEILHDVSISAKAGEIYGLLGPNGAGKTTTIAAALGMIPADGGVIRVLGLDPVSEGMELRRRVGVLPDPSGFYDWMTASNYLSFYAGLYGVRRSLTDIQQRLAQVGLDPKLGQPIGHFSRGMRQRLGLARALIADPEVLVLDEPTNGLDPRGRREIHDILMGLTRDRGVSILLCTHLLDDVERLCSRIGIIVAGRTVAEGAIAELERTRPGHRQFRLRLEGVSPKAGSREGHVTVLAQEGEWTVVAVDPSVPPAAAWSEILAAGWRVTEISRDGGGLEDLYLDLTDRRAA
ncbi:ABC transporter ATP-binding protein [Bosea sp. (in: a-proteobacteria)]|uniref:ABC transporter ATP-binding protein n=1 Tax=Bosea sp. (in: a-proteobacteria) TaxID=1871050 RepID=UPI001209CF33|nr:ABC transporter ATP-binding protein [Bosea sp. (in: a-proteobacteria)]TAJ28567.1 MAG: ABC transporter ATP-binding protein [Bosea sp. (in: a-proteobacteria)]